MKYVNLQDELRRKHYTCCDCGTDFVSDPRAHPMRCPTCREAIWKERHRVADREYRRKKAAAQSEPVHGLDLLAVKIIECAVIDAVKRFGYDTRTVPPNLRSEARMWLQSTGAEWVEALGGDVRPLVQMLEGVTYD